MIEVLRVDPARFELRLLSANSMPGHGPRTPDRWLEDMHAIAVLNASMYMTDGLTSVALMRSRGRVNNPTLGRGMAVVLADPRESGLPPARIAEMDRPGFDSLLAQYRTAVQDLRIIASSPMPHVVWKGSAQTWSQAAIGQDAAGRILFLYSRAPHNPARLGNALLHTDLQLRVLAHVEGSSPAALALSVGRLRKVWYGERSSPLDAASGAEAVPNVFAVFPR